eukprot:1206011-Pyramimonas_sp.AAC.1
MYPEPPILIRRTVEEVELPQAGTAQKIKLLKGTDVFIAVWNLHRSEKLWDKPNDFNPMRWKTKVRVDPRCYTALSHSTGPATSTACGGRPRCG